MVFGTLSSTTPCFSQVTVSHLDICGGFSRPDGACQRNLLSRREKVTDISRPKGKLAAPPPNHPRTLIIAFSAASIEVSLRLQCLWDLENDREGHMKAPEQWLEGRPNFPQVSCLANNF